MTTPVHIRQAPRCRRCGQRVPLVEAGEHELTCSEAELHPFDLAGKHEPHEGRSGKKYAGRGVEKPPSGSA